jgi:hypothetical protein
MQSTKQPAKKEEKAAAHFMLGWYCAGVGGQMYV